MIKIIMLIHIFPPSKLYYDKNKSIHMS